MEGRVHRMNESAIIAGSGEGIPRHSTGGEPWWHAVLWATVCNPVITYYAARSQSWCSAATLIAVFALPFAAIDAYKRWRGTDSVLQWLAVILVFSTNTATYFIAGSLQDQPLNGGISLGELQIGLTLCYVLFGAMYSLSPEDSPISRQK